MAPNLREAEFDDLGTITNISIASMSPTPLWSWRFAKQKEYPQEHRHLTLQLYRRILADTTGCWRIFLAEDESTHEPMGFAVWMLTPLLMGSEQMAAYESRKLPNLKCRLMALGFVTDLTHQRDTAFKFDANRPDAIPARVTATSKAHAAAMKEFFEARYGPHGYFSLRILAVDPNHRKKGAGEVLCRWGIGFAAGMLAVDVDRGRNEEKDKKDPPRPAISVIAATEDGNRLYEKLGFRQLGKIPVKSDEEGDEGVELLALAWEPDPKLLKRAS